MEFEWVCQLGKGVMLCRNEDGTYERVVTGYPYPDTKLSNIDALRQVFSVEEGSDVWEDIDINPKKYIDMINGFFDASDDDVISIPPKDVVLLGQYMYKWYPESAGVLCSELEICMGYEADDCVEDITSINERSKDLDASVLSLCINGIVGDYAELSGFMFNEDKGELTYVNSMISEVLFRGGVSDVGSIDGCTFVNSYLHKYAYKGYVDGSFVYDVSRLCCNSLLCRTFGIYHNNRLQNFEIEEEQFNIGRKEFEDSVFSVNIARAKLINPSVIGVIEDFIFVNEMSVLYLPNISPLTAFLMCTRRIHLNVVKTFDSGLYGNAMFVQLDDNNMTVGDTLQVVPAKVIFEPFRLFYGNEDVLQGIDLKSFLIEYVNDYVVLAYYVLMGYVGEDGRIGCDVVWSIDLSADDWAVDYEIDGIKTEVIVSYGYDRHEWGFNKL